MCMVSCLVASGGPAHTAQAGTCEGVGLYEGEALLGDVLEVFEPWFGQHFPYVVVGGRGDGRVWWWADVESANVFEGDMLSEQR